jgi:hypothetical protein
LGFRKQYGLMGLLAAAILAMLANLMKACNCVARRRQAPRAAAATRHAGIVLKLAICRPLPTSASDLEQIE